MESQRSADGKPQKGPNIHEAFAALSGRQEGIERLFDRNTAAFMESFNLLEAQVAVIQRAMNDLLHGRVRVYDDAFNSCEDGTVYRGIDFRSYLIEYYICQSFAAFAHALRMSSPIEAKLYEASSVEDEVIEFGG